MALSKTGRNDPCPCGSGKKYKKCCLEKDREAQRLKPSSGRLDGLRLDDPVLRRWSMERSRYSPLAAEALALGRDLPGPPVHPWTRARLRDWFAQYDHPVARKRAVTLTQVRRETTSELFERLARRGITLDEASFELEGRGREGRSAWDLAAMLLDAPAERVPSDFGLAVCELWRRLLPEWPSMEMLDELMQTGYDVLDVYDPRAAVERWLSFTEHLVEALAGRARDGAGADAVFPGLQSITHWMRDAEMHLHNASRSDPELARRGVAWCEALITLFPDGASSRSLRREQAELHVMAGELHAAVAAAEALVALEPYDAAGYVVLAKVYSWPKAGELYDCAGAAEILEKALRLPVHNADDFDLEARWKACVAVLTDGRGRAGYGVGLERSPLR